MSKAPAKIEGEGSDALAFVFWGGWLGLLLLPVTRLLDLKLAAGQAAVVGLFGGLALALFLAQKAPRGLGRDRTLALRRPVPVLPWSLAGAMLALWISAFAAGVRNGLPTLSGGAELRLVQWVTGAALTLGLGLAPEAWRGRVLGLWRLGALLTAIYAVAQRLGIEPMAAYAAAGSASRAMASFGNAGYLAAFLCLSWPLFLDWRGARRRGALVLMLAALLATQSRAGLLAAGLQSAVWGWKAWQEGLRPGKSLALALSLVTALLFSLWLAPPSLWLRPTLRPELWSAAGKLFAQAPVLGWGPGSFALEAPAQLSAATAALLKSSGQYAEDPHQVLLLVAAESGGLGLAVFGYLVLLAWRWSRLSRVNGLLFLGLLGLLAESCADRFFFLGGVFLPACAALGLMAPEAAPAKTAAQPSWRAPLFALGALLMAVLAWRPLQSYFSAVDPAPVAASTATGALGGGQTQAQADIQALGLAAQGASDPAAWDRLGSGLAGQGRYAEAGVAFARAMALRPSRARAQNQGNCLMMLGQAAEAEAQFRQAVDLEPGSSDAHFSLGYALFHETKIKEAVAELDKALRLDPRNAAAAKLKEQILR